MTDNGKVRGEDDREEHGTAREDGHGEDRRTVDEDTPTPSGLTSPNEGMDDEPEEPGQSQDYA